MIILMIVGIIVGYLVIAGATMAFTGHVLEWSLDEPGPFFAGVGWFIVLPFLLSYLVIRWLAKREKKPPQKPIIEFCPNCKKKLQQGAYR